MSELLGQCDVLTFGRTVVMVQKRELLRAGTRVAIGSRAFDLMLMLMEGRGKLVDREKIAATVWAGRVVEDNAIEGQISALRKALGDDRTAIHTVSGRGYQFVADVRPCHVEEIELIFSAQEAPASGSTSTAMTSSACNLIGREQDAVELAGIVKTRRLVTLVGTGGIGKTTLAFAVARGLATDFPDGVLYVELAAISSPDDVPTSRVLAMVDAASGQAQPLNRLVQSHSEKRFLLVLDNCEHVIDSVANLTERLLQACPQATVLTTSREALRLNGEYLFRVPSLSVPLEDDVANARSFGAVQMFETLVNNHGTPQPGEKDLPTIAQICRRLDGIPLAIELAAACVSALGLKGVAEQLDDRFAILTRGSRTALPRQQTLAATLDWGYELLDDRERRVLERLSLFAGSFDLDAARRVATCDGITGADVADAMIDLTRKSLVCTLSDDRPRQFRLLETTRAYAREKLNERGEYELWALRYAQYVLRVLLEAEQIASSKTEFDWLSTYRRYVDDLQAASNWAFSADGQSELAIDLTVASIPLSLEAVVLGEYRARVEMALQRLVCAENTDDERAMKLYAVRGICMLGDNVTQRTHEDFQRTRVLAEQLGNLEYRLRAIWGSWVVSYRKGQFGDTLALAETFSIAAEASSIECDRFVARRMLAQSMLFNVNLESATQELNTLLHEVQTPPKAQRMRFLFDERMLAWSGLSYAQWLSGRYEAARESAEHALETARDVDHPTSICYALSEALCPLALILGDYAMLAHFAKMLTEVARRPGTPSWKTRAKTWEAFLALRAGNMDILQDVMLPGLDDMGGKRFLPSHAPLVTETAMLLARNGMAEEAASLVESTLGKAVESEDKASVPELMRAKAILHFDRVHSLDKTSTAEGLLLDAYQRAEQYHLHALRLRIGVSLARVWIESDREKEGLGLLESIRSDTSEPFALRTLDNATHIATKREGPRPDPVETA